MTTSREPPDEFPPIKVRRGNVDEAIKMLDEWLETGDPTEDISDFILLKKLLNQDRLGGRKLFLDE